MIGKTRYIGPASRVGTEAHANLLTWARWTFPREGNDAAEPATKRVSQHPFLADTEGGYLRFNQNIQLPADLLPSEAEAIAVPLRVVKFGGSVLRSVHDLPRAVEYASRKRLRIEARAIDPFNPTIVDADTAVPEPVAERPPLRIGLAGFGTVGQALQARLEEETGFEIAAILVRDSAKLRRVMPAVPLLDETGAFFESGFDVLVDATGGSEIGKALTLRQLSASKDVVSANKAAVAANLRSLRSLQSWGGRLCYSATVGGSAPMLELARRARARGPVHEAVGVLNGTVNFVLDEMGRGLSFDDALALAQKAGFAEAEPEADLSGADAAAKLRILAAEIWGEPGIDIPVEMQPLDRELCAAIVASGERWFQISRLALANGRPYGSVAFVRAAGVPEFPPLPGEWNYLILRLDSGEALKASGRGAGGPPTAEAIVADLRDIAAGRIQSN